MSAGIPLPPGPPAMPALSHKGYEMPPPPRMFNTTPPTPVSGGVSVPYATSVPRPPMPDSAYSVPSSIDNTPIRGGGGAYALPPRPPQPYNPDSSVPSSGSTPLPPRMPPLAVGSGTTPASRPPLPASQLTPGQAERERVAEEAIMQSLNHAVHRYIRQDVAESLGVDEQGKPLGNHNMDGGRHPLEFHPGAPKHNLRLIATLAVALFGLLPLMGHAALTIAIIGCGSVYIADFLGYRKGSVMVMFCALGAFEGTLILSNLYQAYNSIGAMLALINTLVVAGAVAATSMLQYKWLQVTFPELVIFLERLVLVITPIAAIPSLLATCIALAGSRLGMFPFTFCMCILHYLFATPCFSSFLRRPLEDLDDERNAEDSASTSIAKEEDVALHAMARGDAAILTVVLYSVPMVSFFMIQSMPFSTNFALIIMSWAAMFGIFSMYLLYNPDEHLWFLKPKSNTVGGMIEGDPLGIYTLVVKYRDPVMFAGYLLLMEGFIYRLLHSRFQYLFVGLAPPTNGLLLMVVGLLISIIVLMSIRVMRLSELINNRSTIPLLSQSRLAIMFLCIVVAVLVAIVTGMPPVFHPLSAIAAATFNAFLMDRRNGSGFMLFVFSSSMLLLWWMYRTFSFIIMDLRILADGTVVPSSVMTVSILMCYLLGALSFGFSFNENKRPLAVTLCLLGFKVAFVEHILYSQRDTGVYPGYLVFVTSLAGTWTAIKLCRNEVLSVEAASLVVGAFTSKIYTFLYEETAVTYILDDEGQNTLSGIRAILLSMGWIAAFGACSIVSFLELQHEGADRVRIQKLVPGLLGGFVTFAFVAFSCAFGSITRAFVEAISFRWLSVTNEVDALIGGIALLTTVATFPLIARYTSRSALSDCMIPFVVSLGVLLVSPMSFINGTTIDSVNDEEGGASYDTTPVGRALIMLVIVLMAIGRVVPFSKAPAVIRDAYWVMICGIAAVAMHLVMYPAVSLLTTVTFFFFLSLIGITIDISHYRKEVGMELFVVFGCAVAAMILQFLAVGRMDFYTTPGLEHADGILVWNLQVNTRMTVLSIASVAFMVLGVFTHFRVTGNSLLPNATGLTIESIQNVAVVGNYATLLSVVLMLVLNFTIGEGNLPMYIAICSFLLMLVEDDMLCVGLSQEGFRYFPMLLSLLLVYWATLGHNMYEVWTRETPGLAMWTFLYATPVIPSHVSLLLLLYNGTKKGGIIMGSVIVFVVIDLLCIIFTTNAVVQWMAIVGITGQMARLYVAKFWAHSIGTIV